MTNENLLDLVGVLRIEFLLLFVYWIGLRKKLDKQWQTRATIGLLTLIAMTFIAAVYFGYLERLAQP